MLTHTGTDTVETERLILRRFKYTDDESMLKNWIADENIQRMYSEPVYSTKATKAVIGYGFDRINLHKVQICTKTINVPSRRVIEKCGFTYEGTLRDYFFMDGEYVGRHYFSMLREEYEASQK